VGGFLGGAEQGILTVTVLMLVTVIVFTCVSIFVAVLVMILVMVLKTGVAIVTVLKMVVGGGHLIDLGGGGGGGLEGAPRPSIMAAETAKTETKKNKRLNNRMPIVSFSNGDYGTYSRDEQVMDR
jgi:hypothetical protein